MSNVRKYGYFKPFVPNNRVRLPVRKRRGKAQEPRARKKV